MFLTSALNAVEELVVVVVRKNERQGKNESEGSGMLPKSA